MSKLAFVCGFEKNYERIKKMGVVFPLLVTTADDQGVGWESSLSYNALRSETYYGLIDI